MRAKPGVVIAGACFEIGWACAVAASVYERQFGGAMVVTSVKDSTHGEGSLHYKGRAADLRTRTLTPDERKVFTALLKAELEPHGFDVVLEADHIHVEFDPKVGEKFIEVTT